MQTDSGQAFVRDAGDADFEREVVLRSRSVPVVVDFWAPWCGPCRALGPVLERVTDDHAGEFELVKINVDESPEVSRRFGIRSIPLVAGFLGGEPVVSFVGAQPEAQVRAFVKELLERHAGGGAPEASEPDPAEASRAEQALAAARARAQAQPADLTARIELGRALAAAGRHEEGLCELLASVRRDPAFDDGAARRAMLEIFERLGDADPLSARFRRELATALFR